MRFRLLYWSVICRCIRLRRRYSFVGTDALLISIIILKECELFSEEYLLTFNANKSSYIVFPHVGDNVSTNINLMNNQIASSDSSIHLGDVIGPNISTKRVEASIADFKRKNNVLLSSFHNVSTNCLYKIFISTCMSLYGCQIWDVSHRYTNNSFVSWREAI